MNNQECYIGDLENGVSEKKIMAWSYSRSIKLFSGINLFFYVLYALYDPFNLIGCIISLIGFLGAKHYSKGYLRIYMCMLVIGIISQIIMLIFTIDNAREKKVNISTITYILFGINILIESWVCKIVYSFLRLLNSLPILDRNSLRGGWNPYSSDHRVLFVYY